MRRWILTVASLAVLALWLLLAYIPALPRPTLAYPAWMTPVMALAAAAGLVIFLLIQGWLVYATSTFFGPQSATPEAVRAEFGLRRGWELFWTALPIGMTLGVAALAYGLWAALLA